MRKRLIAYVYDLCARGNLCVRGNSFARKRLIAYVVRLLRSRPLMGNREPCVKNLDQVLWMILDADLSLHLG